MTFKDGTASSLRVLVGMLTRMRPAGSKTERRFIREYIRPLGVQTDRAGNLIKRIGTAPVLWSCHTDTVHKLGGTQPLTISNNVARLDPLSKSNCLGADCTTGVWLMREMILAGVEGLYIFHRGEECGGIGSSFIARHTPELLAGIKYAIAFDRKGYENIITHQFDRCCSDAFAHSLSDALASAGLPHYKPDDTGLFTDTANYTHLVGECTNLSVGYHSQHSKLETQDLGYAVELLDALLRLDMSMLISARAPGEVDPDPWPQCAPVTQDTYDRMTRLVMEYPDIAADVMADYGLGASDLMDEIYARTGAVPNERFSEQMQ